MSIDSSRESRTHTAESEIATICMHTAGSGKQQNTRTSRGGKPSRVQSEKAEANANAPLGVPDDLLIQLLAKRSPESARRSAVYSTHVSHETLHETYMCERVC